MDFTKKKLQQEFEDKLETEQHGKRHLERRARKLIKFYSSIGYNTLVASWSYGYILIYANVSVACCVHVFGCCSWLICRQTMKMCSAQCNSWRRSVRNWLQNCRTPNYTWRAYRAATMIWRRNRGSQFQFVRLSLPFSFMVTERRTDFSFLFGRPGADTLTHSEEH